MTVSKILSFSVLPGPLELWYHPHRCGLVGCGWVVVVEEEEKEEEIGRAHV